MMRDMGTQNDLSAIQTAEAIQKADESVQLDLFLNLPFEQAVPTFEYLPITIQKQLLNALSSDRLRRLLNALSPDDRTALFEELPDEFAIRLMKYLSPKERAIASKLWGYAEFSVGRLMTTDFISIKLDWTVQDVLEHIRSEGTESETLDVLYAVDDQGKLLDDFRIQEFLLAPPDVYVRDLADYTFISLHVNDAEEDALKIFRKYNRVALPVVDERGILIGIVTFDDIMAVQVQEDTEDIQKIGGMEALDAPYMQIPFLELMRKRAGWLTILFLGEMLTASTMGYFEAEIAQAVVLALFLPLIISSGGNAGSQASTLIVRAIALGEVTLRDWWRIMRREILSGLFLGAFLGLIGFFRVILWGSVLHSYGEHYFVLSLTIFFALLGVVMWGTFIGSMLPLILDRLGLDPAVSSAPFVATLVDVTGLIIYFSVAILFLSGTLL